MKTCACCKTPKLASEFWKQGGRRPAKDGLQAYCKSCQKEKIGIWRRDNAAGQRAIQRKGKLWDTYRLTPESYSELFDAQSGCCAICKRPGGGTSLHFPLDIDHCHVTGNVRGLLCCACNLGLGKFMDSPTRLRAAADYLESALTSDLK